MTLEQEAAALYNGPPDGFVARRNARAKELRGEDAALAREVAALPKPAASAWAVDRLARAHADVLEDLLGLAADLRAAQDDRDGPRVRELTAQAHERVESTVAAVADLAAEEGAPLSDALRQQVEQTLRAAMADEQAAAAVRAGLLVKPLVPSGFGPVDLEGAVAVPGAGAPPPPRPEPVVPKRDARLELARRAARVAAQDVRSTSEALEARTRDAEHAREREERANAAAEALREQLEKAEGTRAAAQAALRAAAEEREAAAAAVQRAREVLAQAEAALGPGDRRAEG